MIEGVVIKKLTVHTDKRGFFVELIRKSDPLFAGFAQVSHSLSNKGVLKAWHLHRKQTDLLYVVSGDIKLALFDLRKTSKTYKELAELLLGESYKRCVVKIPPGVAHGYLVLHSPLHIIYLMNREYDPRDELRLPPDDPQIGYDWKAKTKSRK